MHRVDVEGVDSGEVEVVVAHRGRATLRVGEVFLKIDGDQARADVEVEAMQLAPVPTPTVLWRKPPVLALAAVSGEPLGRLGEPSPHSSQAWAAAGAALRALHDAPLPPWQGRTVDETAAELDVECAWLVANDVVSPEIVRRNRSTAAPALRESTPVFTHGDLQVAHVFIDGFDGISGGQVSGILDWSEACQGDAMFDLASLTLGHPERLDDVAAGYQDELDLEVIRAWWSIRSLRIVRWLIKHGFDPAPEIAVLASA